MTLVHQAGQNEELEMQFMSGPQQQLKIDIPKLLMLSPQDTFHVNRFLGLWRHDEFRNLCTALCETSVGRVSFNLLAFSHLKEYRIIKIKSFSFS